MDYSEDPREPCSDADCQCVGECRLRCRFCNKVFCCCDMGICNNCQLLTCFTCESAVPENKLEQCVKCRFYFDIRCIVNCHTCKEFFCVQCKTCGKTDCEEKLKKTKEGLEKRLEREDSSFVYYFDLMPLDIQRDLLSIITDAETTLPPVIQKQEVR